MLTFVLIINAILTLACFWLAWHLWKLRLTLRRATTRLERLEKQAYAILSQGPQVIQQSQAGVYQWHQQIQQWERQMQTLQQVLQLMSFAQGLWLRQALPKAMKRV